MMHFIMPRKARIDHAGRTHHVTARSFNDMVLFKDDADRAYYLFYLKWWIKKTGCICYAWVLMDTHVHLLLRTTEQPIWKVMKPLHCDYAHYYNRKYNRQGPLFSDCCKSIAIQDQYYLEYLVRYIHLNPIRAGVCKTMDQLDRYRWSGHRSIMENDDGGFQEIRQVLQRFGNPVDAAREKYREFISRFREPQLPVPTLSGEQDGSSRHRRALLFSVPACRDIKQTTAAFQCRSSRLWRSLSANRRCT